MGDWEYSFADAFRQRDNDKTKMGACIGKVISVSPPTISIANGEFIINSDKLYVCNQILERGTKYDSHSNSGNIHVSCTGGSGGSFSATSTGTIHLNAVWSVGDYVLVIPDIENNTFFVVDVLRKINGCNESLK